MRLLIAESNATLARIYSWFFLGEGFEVETVADALQCALVVRDRLPDLVILEYELPWGGAMTVLDKLGNDPRCSSVPVILNSCSAVPESLRHHPVPPVAGCLLKPYRLKDLADLVQSVLEPPYGQIRFARDQDETADQQRKITLASFGVET